MQRRPLFQTTIFLKKSSFGEKKGTFFMKLKKHKSQPNESWRRLFGNDLVRKMTLLTNEIAYIKNSALSMRVFLELL